MGHYVYLHRKADTGEVFYVGKGFGTRATKKSCRNEYWKRIVAKHGRTIEIYRSNLTEDEAFKLEAELIAHYGRETLCNLTDGGEGGVNPSPSTRAKMSAKRKGVKFTDEHRNKLRVASTGRKHSKETIEKLHVAFLGKKRAEFSVETRLKMSDSAKKHIKTPEHCRAISAAKKGKPRAPFSAESIEKLRLASTGRECSQEARLKISAANKGRKHTPEAIQQIAANNKFHNNLRKIPIFCSNGMRFLCSHDAAIWLQENGVPSATRNNIVSCCNGKLKTAYGFKWSHALLETAEQTTIAPA